jgi:hypothetical protein
VRREALRYIPGAAGKDWRDVLGSDVLPGAERLRGKEHDRNRRPVQVSGTARRGPARARNVQLSVHRRVPAAACVDEVDGDLRVFDPPGGAGVLALDPDGVRAFFTSPVSPATSTAFSSPRCSSTYSRTSSRTRSASHLARPSRCCMLSGLACPAHSTIDQQFLRGRSDSSPAPRPSPGAGAPPARTGPLSGPSGPRTPPASGQGLRCDPRPPQDLQSSHTGDQRWPQPSAAGSTSKITLYGWTSRSR